MVLGVVKDKNLLCTSGGGNGPSKERKKECEFSSLIKYKYQPVV
jgi:hypothetical protein